jgi:hypothetical protein
MINSSSAYLWMRKIILLHIFKGHRELLPEPELDLELDLGKNKNLLQGRARYPRYRRFPRFLV